MTFSVESVQLLVDTPTIHNAAVVAMTLAVVVLVWRSWHKIVACDVDTMLVVGSVRESLVDLKVDDEDEEDSADGCEKYSDVVRALLEEWNEHCMVAVRQSGKKSQP